MKKIIFLSYLLCNTIFGMNDNDKTSEIMELIYQKDHNENFCTNSDGFYILKNEYSGLINSLPLIGNYALSNWHNEHTNDTEYEQVRNWILKNVLFANKETLGLYKSLSHISCLTEFSLEIDTQENKIDFKTDGCVSYAMFSASHFDFKLDEKYDFDITAKGYDSTIYPLAINLALIRSTVYLDQKIHPFHKELLCQIYQQGAKNHKSIILTDSEMKKFNLLPSSFQKIIEPYIQPEQLEKKSSTCLLQ